MKLQSGDKIRLAPGATILAVYSEFDCEAKLDKPQGKGWISHLYLDGNRIGQQFAYDHRTRCRRNRAWMRRRVMEYLDAIAPGWEVVPKARELEKGRKG